MDETKLRNRLGESFDATQAEIDAVVREVLRLDNSGTWDDVSDTEFTVEFVTEKLEMADRPLGASWNWWLGMNDYFDSGDFRRYQI